MPDYPEDQKDISESPAPTDGVAEHIRADLIQTLQRSPLTPALCTRLGRMLEAAERFLTAKGENVEAVLGRRIRGGGVYSSGIAMSPSSSQENFGSSLARELMSGLRSLAPGRDPAKLTEALATARRDGLPIADQIEESLKALLVASSSAPENSEKGTPEAPANGARVPAGIPVAVLPEGVA